MNVIRAWAIGLCLSSIGLSLLKMLMPEGRLKQTVSMLMSVCFFCCLIEPLGEIGRFGRSLFDGVFTDQTVSTSMIEITDQQIDAVLSEAMCMDAENRLKDYHIVVNEAVIERDRNDRDGIYIHRVVLYVEGENAQTAVFEQLETAWGVEVEVIMDE